MRRREERAHLEARKVRRGDDGCRGGIDVISMSLVHMTSSTEFKPLLFQNLNAA